jgi:predicted dehydrogenase
LESFGAGVAVRKLHFPVLQKLSEEMRIVAVCNSTRKSAEMFVQSISGNGQIVDNYDALLESASIDATQEPKRCSEFQGVQNDGCGSR